MNVPMGIRLKTWTPAVPRKIPDNIVSSSYGTTRVFVPSYEKEGHPRIEQLLANDYQRIWWQEKKAWDKIVTAQKITTKKILPRMMIKRKVPTCVTVKYPTKEERSKGRKKKDLKKSSNSKIEKEIIFAKHNNPKLEEHEKIKLENEETKSEKSLKTELYKENEEIKSEKWEKAKSEKSEKIRLEKYKETEEEKDEETKSEKSKKIRSQKHEETDREKDEETKSEKSKEMRSQKYEETGGEIYQEETKSEKSEETRLEKREETEAKTYEETKSEKYEEIKF